MAGNPCRIFIFIRCIDNQQICFIVYFIDQNVVYYTTIFIAHRAIAHLAVIHAAAVIRGYQLHIFQCIRAGQHQFPHMGYIKQPTGCAHSHMFLNYTCFILHWQQIAAKRYNFAACCHMAVIQRSFFLHCHSSPQISLSLISHRNCEKMN